MATAGDGSPPYQSGGAGGKFRKRPSRRSIPATPYSRPPTAVRNNKPSMLKKLVDPASRLIYAGAHKLFDVFRKNLPPLSLGPPEINEETANVHHKEDGNGNSASTSAATGISELELLLQQKTFTRSEIQRLTSVLHSKTTEPPSDDSLEKHGDKRDNFHAAISTPVVTSRVFQEEIASPAELAKHYMGSRPAGQTPRHDSKLLPRTSMTPVAQKTVGSLRNLENGFATPRSRGRSAMYTMARTPYSQSPSTFSDQIVKSDYGHGAALTSSQEHEGKTAHKRRSSVLDDDIGSGGPLRRIRHKPNLLSQRDRKELGYPVFQHLDGAGQNVLTKDEPEPKVPNYASVPTKSTQSANKILEHLDKPSPIEKSSVSTLSAMREKSPNKLRLDMLHGQALRSLEKVNSPKFLPSSANIRKPVVPELTSQSIDKTEENVSRKFPVSHNMLTSVNGDMTDTLKDKAPIIEITDLPSKVMEEPQKKHSFQMSAPEGSFEMDDDDDIHDNGHVLLPLVENNKTETSATEIIKPSALPEVSKTPELVEYNKPMFSEVSKVPERVELKKAENDISTPKTDFGFFGGSASEQGLGFKIPISSQASPSVASTETSELTQSTLQIEKISPVKVSPFSFSADQLSEFKPNADSDPKVNNSNSAFNSVPKDDHVKLSVSNNDENGNWNGNDKKSTNMFGKSESLPLAVSAATSTNGIFSFGTSTKNSSAPNTTPALNPPTFSSLAPSPASATTATTTTAISTTTTTTPAAIFSTSVSPQAFSFGSGTSTAPTTSVAETKSTSTASPFAITTFATTTTTTSTTTGSSLFGFSSPAAATSTTTTTGNGLFGFSSPAAATLTSTTTASGLFGLSSPAAATTSTSTTTGSGLFGFGSSAAATSTTTTTTTGSVPFGFSSSAAATSTTTGSVPFGFGSSSAASSTTATVSVPFSFGSSAAATSSTVTVSAPFGFSSPAAATSTATTTPGSGLFGFSSPAAASSTTTGNGVFGFSAPAAATSTTASTGSGLFGFSSSATAPSTTASQSHGSFFNITNGFQASTPASSTSTIFGSSAPAFGSSSNFGINSVGPTSENKSGSSTSGSTTSIFGSTWQQPTQKSSGFGSTFTSSPSSSVFSFGASSTPTPSFATAGASNSSFGGPSVFGNTTPVFGAVAASPNNNNDQMSMEDSMAEDSMQTHSPISPFGQAPVSAPGFMFGSATPTQTPTPSLTPAAVPFSFGGQQNQAAMPQNPFQSSSVEFNAGGGSFSLGSGGEKSSRRIVRVTKSKNRKK
ncbi:hypothetical protein SSX86_017883 [Deinandra increscens subsp. villosa]|uniref:Nuclear pore complex protein NUP1 n=1 Tax=Deinandra increscens subsp. villosa TaxID=3103831 RepID=A0AAP0CXP5_9ASTR